MRATTTWVKGNHPLPSHIMTIPAVPSYDEGRYDECRVGSLYLLLEPRLPFWTRIKTLQMVSTLLEPAGAEGCLQQAEAVIKLCDPDDFRTALFRDDNAEMVDDVVQWRIERGLVGESIDGEDDAEDGELVEEDKEIDDQLEEKLKEETETETKAIGRLQTLPVRAKPAELAQKPDTPAAEGLPLPQESDTQ